MANAIGKNWRKQAFTTLKIGAGNSDTVFKIMVNPNAENGDDRDFDFTYTSVGPTGAAVALTSILYNNTGSDAGKITVTYGSAPAENSKLTLIGAIESETKVTYV